MTHSLPHKSIIFNPWRTFASDHKGLSAVGIDQSSYTTRIPDKIYGFFFFFYISHNRQLWPVILRNRAQKEVKAVIASGYCWKALQGRRSEMGPSSHTEGHSRDWNLERSLLLIFKEGSGNC